MSELEAVAEPARAATGPEAFLAGGGEMGALMRARDWARSALGPVETWPQSLRTTVSTCLNCAFPIAVWWGPGFVMLYNDEYRAVISAKHPAALGEKGMLVWPEIWDVIGPMLNQVMERGEATRSRDLLLIMDRHGYAEETYFSFSYSPIRDETGGVGGVFCPVMETTEKVIGERRLRTLSALSAAVQEARDAEEACKRAARILAANRADVPFSLIYLLDSGGETARLIANASIPAGHPTADETISLNANNAAWPLGNVARNNEPAVVSDLALPVCGIIGGGAPQPVRDAVVLPLVAPGQERPAGFLVAGVNPLRSLDAQYRSFFDFAAGHIAMAVANAQAYQAERKRAEALAELDRAKTVFFSNVSHEFRTPLTLMLGTLEETLAVGDLSDTRRGQLAIAHRNSLRLLRLVNTLLDFSRVEAGRIEASYEQVDLASLTTELASNFRSACERAGLDLEVDCETLPGPTYVDREMWEKIVLNLVSNAFKFTLHGAITVRLSASDRHVRLTVSDTGVGIPKEHLPRVFERFHRVPDARGRTHEGTGIGLALAQELVKLHGGSVAVESEEGRGSTFTVSIPLGSAHLPADRIGAARRLSATSIRAQAFVDEALRWLPSDSDSPDLPSVDRELAFDMHAPHERRRVLVVDDNADMRDYIARLLRPFYDVDMAPDGREALAAIVRRRPDLVLSDVMMPGLDGFELVRAIRADASLKGVPVILLSARAGEEEQVEGLGTGADDYLVKPFSARELLARINTHLQMAKLRREANAELLAREQLYRALVSASSDVVYRMGPDWTEMRHLLGRAFIADTEGPSHAWLEKYIHPDDQPRVMAAIKEAIRTRTVFELEHRVRRIDGTLGWTFSRAVPLLDANGNITEWIGAASDVTERKTAEERQKLLINELNHRVKNTLASVQSIAMQTVRNAPTVRDFHDSFVARLTALSRAHDLLTRSNWRSASLTEIVRQTLEPYGLQSERVRFGGPEIRLSPSAAVTLSMGLHELATNAAKYGAMSDSRGRIDVGWKIDGAADMPVLAIDWRERDGPAVEPPSRRGFGSRLIERGIAQELDGQVALEFDAPGVQCRIRLPLSDRVSVS